MGPVLGLETSCDDTAVAVLAVDGGILAQVRSSQDDEHSPYGGIVPEIAARAHALRLDRLIARAMAEAGLDFPDLEAIAVTAGPGLIGGLAVGVVTAAAIGSVHRLPVIPINHLEGHALTARLTNDARFPYLLLLLSGGHSQLIAVEGVGRYRRLGTTLDDALGEAFDKTAKLCGLGFPGGPAVERMARMAIPCAIPCPGPWSASPAATSPSRASRRPCARPYPPCPMGRSGGRRWPISVRPSSAPPSIPLRTARRKPPPSFARNGRRGPIWSSPGSRGECGPAHPAG